jgi:uncharacterized protein YbjT (DUF2867 family)
MKVVIFGATGMIGHGTLLECLADDDVTEVVTVVRRPMGIDDAKLREVVHADMLELEPIADRLAGLDACLYCLGISSSGLDEAAYRQVTVDMPLAATRTLKRVSPDLAFVYVSGQGTDSTGKSRLMWARVKGDAENQLLAAWPHAYMFRPGFIQPAPGVTSATGWIRAAYRVTSPLVPLLRKAPALFTTSERLGQAMVAAARERGPSRVLESRDINALADRAAAR